MSIMRADLHQMVDMVPEDYLQDVKEFLQNLPLQKPTDSDQSKPLKDDFSPDNLTTHEVTCENCAIAVPETPSLPALMGNDAESKPCPPNCPYCHSASFLRRYGFKNGRQRYHCKKCQRTFNEATNTIRAGTSASLATWDIVIEDTINGVPIDATAQRINLSHSTVFNMRHRVLLGLSDPSFGNDIVLSNVAELDETYVLESRKGKKFDESSDREPRLHGRRAEKRGLSDEQVCICTGVQRACGPAYANTVNLASPSADEIKTVFDGHIAPGTVLLTDGMKSYKALQDNMDCFVGSIPVAAQKSKGIASLNNVNSFHSFIKERYRHARSYATKYLNRYNKVFAMAFRNREETIKRLQEILRQPCIMAANMSNRRLKEATLNLAHA